MKKLFFLVLVLASGPVWADATADTMTAAQNTASLYQGTFSIDVNNPVSFLMETLIPNQEVEIQLTARTLSTSSIDILTFPMAFGIHMMTSAPLVPVSFEHFQVYIEGCNVSSQIVNLCNASQCWTDNPSVAHPTSATPQTADLGSDFSMLSSVVLTMADFSTCPAGTFSGFVDDSQYHVTMAEAGADNCPELVTGGRVSYRVAVRNFSPLGSRKKKGN